MELHHLWTDMVMSPTLAALETQALGTPVSTQSSHLVIVRFSRSHHFQLRLTLHQRSTPINGLLFWDGVSVLRVHCRVRTRDGWTWILNIAAIAGEYYHVLPLVPVLMHMLNPGQEDSAP